MITLSRSAVSLACAVATACCSTAAETNGGTASSLSAELAAFLAAQPKWTTSASISAAYGYKDNLLLSFSGEERSPFARGGVEMLLLRVPTSQFDFTFYGEAEGTRFLGADVVRDQSKVWLQMEPGYRVGENVTLSLPVTAYYYHQVFDVSETDVERLVADLKVKGIMLAPTARWQFHPSWWLEAQAAGQRKRYEDGANDGWIGEGSARIGWNGLGWLDVRLAATKRWRDFDHRVQYSAVGRERPGTKLKIGEREGELRFTAKWDEAARWETTTRAMLLDYRDNGSGYFNYREQKVAQEVEWHSEVWRVRAGGSASRIDFDVQKAGVGVDPPARLKDEFTAECYIERKLSAQWAVFGTYSWERSRSNDVFASYSVNEGLLGVRWSWEK